MSTLNGLSSSVDRQPLVEALVPSTIAKRYSVETSN